MHDMTMEPQGVWQEERIQEDILQQHEFDSTNPPQLFAGLHCTPWEKWGHWLSSETMSLVLHIKQFLNHSWRENVIHSCVIGLGHEFLKIFTNFSEFHPQKFLKQSSEVINNIPK